MQNNRTIWLERIILSLGIGLYLYIMQAESPNGDGRVYMRQIEAGNTIWNPNHLYMQPIGFWFWKFIKASGIGWNLFQALKVLSGLSAAMSCVLFHVAITALNVRHAELRVGATCGLFFSAHYLSMAIAEEYYMIQMPILMAILVLIVYLESEQLDQHAQSIVLAVMGCAAALSTAISMNNSLLALALGIGVMLRSKHRLKRGDRSVIILWAAGVGLSLPLFLLPYFMSHSDVSLFEWVAAYQGAPGSATGALYGIEWSISGVVISAAKLVYGFGSSIILLGELGSFVEALLRSRTLEYLPDTLNLIMTSVSFLVILGLSVPFVCWLFRTTDRRGIRVFLLLWIAGYFIFNFLFSDTSDQFWFSILPAVWALIVLFITDPSLCRTSVSRSRSRVWVRIGLWVIVFLLAIINSASVVAPRAFPRIEERRAAVMDLLEPGDLLITTGWDDLVWMNWEGQDQTFERILLMDLALKDRGGDKVIEKLPERITAHLGSGKRVIVARVFDLDREGRPWEQLNKLQWSRSRLIELLSGFHNQEIGRVEGVVFRELSIIKRAVGDPLDSGRKLPL